MSTLTKNAQSKSVWSISAYLGLVENHS